MIQLVVTDEARRDLRQIERYSRRTWGAEKAHSYRDLIIKSFARLMIRPERGRPQEEWSPGLRRINVREHAVFYVVRGDDLVIARVIHQAMDIGPDLFRTPRRP